MHCHPHSEALLTPEDNVSLADLLSLLVEQNDSSCCRHLEGHLEETARLSVLAGLLSLTLDLSLFLSKYVSEAWSLCSTISREKSFRKP